MSEILQILGALMVLVPFALAQFRVLGMQSYPYLVLNALGSGILAVLALLGRQWGFLLLEGAWSLVSIWGLSAVLRGRRHLESGVEHAPTGAKGPIQHR
jgi:hypothetical protein